MSAGAGAVAHDAARVLVVDDSQVIRKAIEKMLKADFDPVLAEDGESGWQRLMQDDNIKLLITDIEMPHLDGYQFICRVRAADNARIREIPIITITGSEDDETRARAYACGSTDFITKPLSATELQARVQAYVKFDQWADSGSGSGETDPISRLKSGAYFVRQGRQVYTQARDSRADLALLRVEIDKFGQLYKELGEAAATEVLVWMGKRIQAVAGKDALAARLRGDEFAVILFGVGRETAVALGERLRAAVKDEPMLHARKPLKVTVSMGVAALSSDGRDTFEQFLALVEQRLSHAKSEGGDRVGVTALGEELPALEELVLAAPAGTPDPFIPLPELQVEELTVEELEEMIKREAVTQRGPASAQVAGMAASARAAPAPPARRAEGSDISDLLSVDQALRLLGSGNGGRLDPYLESLVERTLPLLELYNRQRQLGLDTTLAGLKQRLGRGR